MVFSAYSEIRHRVKGVFIWKEASPLGEASFRKSVEFYLAFTWEFYSPSCKAGSSVHAFINFILLSYAV